MRESKLQGLLGHRAADFGDAVADIDYCGLARRIEKLASIRRKKPAPFAADGDGKIPVKIARKKGGVV